jgi:FkbM family methyltransferase
MIKRIIRRLSLSTPGINSLTRSLFYGRRGFENSIQSDKVFLNDLRFRNKVIFDIGASRGDFSQFFASSAGSRGYVVAFEAHPHSYEQLKMRIGRDIGRNVLAENKAVGLEPGVCQLIARKSIPETSTIDANIQNTIIEEGDYLNFDIPMCSLDSYLESNKHKYIPDFIKIDAEGAEYDILRGSAKLMSMFHPELFIEIHGADMALKENNIKNIVELLEKFGYRIYHVESGKYISLDDCVIAREGHIYCTYNF